MDAKSVTLIFMDKKERFEEIKPQISMLSYKVVHDFSSVDELKAYIYNPAHVNEYIVLFLHIAANYDLEGFRSGLKEDIRALFPKLTILLVTRNNTTIRANDLEGFALYTYFHIKKKIETEYIHPQKVGDLIQASKSSNASIDYGIITALFDDEFESINKLFDWEPDSNSEDSKIRYKIGYLKTDHSKRVVASFQVQTGMVEAAVVATHMLERYKPKYLLMPGVCGGAEKLKLGTIVVAKGVFLIQRGKVSDIKDTSGNPITQALTNGGDIVDLNDLRNVDGKRIKVSVEDFERESDLISLDSNLISVISEAIPDIKAKIEDRYSATGFKCFIEFEKMACSSMVINKGDYFEQNIKTIDRKAMAVEMESYGIARASQLANNGKTKFLIFKGVMDNAKDKTDEAKPNAAKMSALFLQHLLEGDILK